MQDIAKLNFGQRYTKLKKLGQGGMGTIYQAYDQVKDRVVAIKTISPKYKSSPDVKLRFKNEFLIMSKFQHPNTVKVFEYNLTNDGEPFITMEHIKGQNLSQISKLSL